jgi:DNA-binding transcriptional LysR family regulator
MARQLRTGEVDLGLASQPLQDPSLSTIELGRVVCVIREEVLLAVPPTHPLAQRKRINATAAKRFRDLATQHLRKTGPSEKVTARPLAG